MEFRLKQAACAAALVLGIGAAQAQLKIAYIDPLSGSFANVGEQGLKHFQAMADEINAKGGINGQKVEVIGFDNKVSPQEALSQLQRVIDQGIRYITQGNGSSVAGALIEAVNRHNERNPGKEILYLNYAAVDPAFTNEKCSFWHFRFDANSDMKMEALTTWMAQNKSIKKVYLINQDYSFGHAVKKAARESGIPGYRARIRPIVSRITIHWPSFYNVVTGKTLALPNLIALQHIPLSPAGVIAKRPAPIALPNSCAAEWRMAPDAVFSPYASVRYFTPHMVHSQYNLL